MDEQKALTAAITSLILCKEFEMYVAVKWVQSLSAMNVEEMFGPFRSYTDAEIYCKDKRFKLYSIYMLSKI